MAVVGRNPEYDAVRPPKSSLRSLAHQYGLKRSYNESPYLDGILSAAAGRVDVSRVELLEHLKIPPVSFTPHTAAAASRTLPVLPMLPVTFRTESGSCESSPGMDPPVACLARQH